MFLIQKLCIDVTLFLASRHDLGFSWTRTNRNELWNLRTFDFSLCYWKRCETWNDRYASMKRVKALIIFTSVESRLLGCSICLDTVECYQIRKSDWVSIVTGRKNLHHCYDFSCQCWFASEDARIYCNIFSSSNEVVCSRLVVEYTVRLAINKCSKIGTKWLFFFIFIDECCVVSEKNIDKQNCNRISHQIWYKWCLKGAFRRGVRICEAVSKSVLTQAFLVLCFGRFCDCLTERNW